MHNPMGLQTIVWQRDFKTPIIGVIEYAGRRWPYHSKCPLCNTGGIWHIEFFNHIKFSL